MVVQETKKVLGSLAAEATKKLEECAKIKVFLEGEAPFYGGEHVHDFVVGWASVERRLKRLFKRHGETFGSVEAERYRALYSSIVRKNEDEFWSKYSSIVEWADPDHDSYNPHYEPSPWLTDKDGYLVRKLKVVDTIPSGLVSTHYF